MTRSYQYTYLADIAKELHPRFARDVHRTARWEGHPDLADPRTASTVRFLPLRVRSFRRIIRQQPGMVRSPHDPATATLPEVTDMSPDLGSRTHAHRRRSPRPLVGPGPRDAAWHLVYARHDVDASHPYFDREVAEFVRFDPTHRLSYDGRSRHCLAKRSPISPHQSSTEGSRHSLIDTSKNRWHRRAYRHRPTDTRTAPSARRLSTGTDRSALAPHSITVTSVRRSPALMRGTCNRFLARDLETLPIDRRL